MYFMIFAEQANTEGSSQFRGSLYTPYKAQNQLLWVLGANMLSNYKQIMSHMMYYNQ